MIIGKEAEIQLMMIEELVVAEKQLMMIEE